MNYFDPYPLAADKSIVMAWDSEVARAAQTPWLAEALAGAGSELFPRFADCYAQLRALPRGARRALQRQLARSQDLAAVLPEWLHGEAGHALQQKLARTLAGAALLLALGQGVAQANTINVTPKAPPGIILGDGKCSLAEAIIAANTNAPFDACPAGGGAADTIVLQKGTQTLTSYVPSIYSPTGLPLITSNITIEGNGAKITRKKSGPQFRLVGVYVTGNLTLNNLTLSGGSTAYGGGAVFNGGYLTINNCIITGNNAGGGGAISNYGGYSQINNSTISKNTANVGGGIFNRSFAPGYRGDIVLNNSVVTGNKAVNGAGIYSAGGVNADVVINNSTISKNTASGFGGGIENDYGATYVNNSVVTGNKSKYAGGGIFNFGDTAELVVTSSTLSKNSGGFVGGGIANIFGYNGVFFSTITGNTAKFYGGGIYNFHPSGFVNVGNSFSKNRAKYGPDIYTVP